MSATHAPIVALVAAADALDRHGLAYAVTGSFALTYYSAWRFTHDADLKVGLVKDFDARLRRVEDELRERGFRILDETTFDYDGFTIEIYPARTDLDREALRRRVKARLFQSNDREFWILAPEDLILVKMREHLKYPASTKHADDVKTLLAARGDLDVDYLQDRLRRHGLMEAWEKWIEPTE